MIDIASLRAELRAADAAGRRQDHADLRQMDRSNAAWMAAGAGLVVAGAALLAGLLAMGQAVLMGFC